MRVTLKSCVMGGCAAMALVASGCAGSAPPASEVATAPPAPAVAPVAGKLEIKVLSSRADLVSGGDARVQVKASDGAKASAVKVTLNGRDLAAPLTYDAATNSLNGVVTGLANGANTLLASNAGGGMASLQLVNYPITGPILSGPHMTPYECRTVESGLGEATDKDCSAPVRYDWFYQTTAGAFKPLDRSAAPPADLAAAKTIDGKTVPYTVRVESGVINRSIYRIAVLADAKNYVLPAGARAPAVYEAAWNGRLAVTFGGGAGTQYNQGTNKVESALSDLYLSRGFAFMNSTELVNQQHGNAVLQGETLMMLKEHFVEAYGVPKWTVGTGGSGGSIQQMVITQIYPGLLDGLQPSLSFPDSSMQTADCGVLQRFWKSEDGKAWSQEKKSAVEGYSPGTCGSWERSFVPVVVATNKPGCALKDESLIYDPKTNPKGARCTMQEMRVNIYGRDPKTGFARKPQDNVGVQYGLKGLNEGKITVDEFLTLNEKVGGNDIDGGFVPQRSVGDPVAIKAIYESGLFNTFGGGLGTVPMLHYRGYTDTTTPGDIHDRHRDLTIRARLEKANGRSDNEVIWVADRAPAPSKPATVNLAPLALDTMTKWLDSMAEDSAPLTTDKVVKHKPFDAVDAYWTPDGKRVNEVASWDPSTSWNKTYPIHLEPRIIAGAPVTNDIMKCQLKPVDFAEYKVKFTAAQQKKMKSVFPDGVCDWTKPGVGYSKAKGTYVKY